MPHRGSDRLCPPCRVPRATQAAAGVPWGGCVRVGWQRRGMVWGHLCSRHPFPAGQPQAVSSGSLCGDRELGWGQNGAGGHGGVEGVGFRARGRCGRAGLGTGMEGSGVWPWGHLGALVQDQGGFGGFVLGDWCGVSAMGSCQHSPRWGSGRAPRVLTGSVPPQGPQGHPGSRGQDGAQVRGWVSPTPGPAPRAPRCQGLSSLCFRASRAPGASRATGALG